MEDNFELEKVTAFDMLAHAMICVHEAAQAGADVFVAGNAVFGAENPAQALVDIRKSAQI